MALPLTRFGKRNNSREPSQDSTTILSNRPNSDSNQKRPLGDAPATSSQEYLDSLGIKTSSRFARNDTPTTVHDPNESRRTLRDKNGADIDPRETIEPGTNHDTGFGAGGLTNNPEALDGNSNDLRLGFMPLKSSRIWDTYVEKAGEEDRDLVEDWDRVIDVTLVFAALFSAVSTAFIIESSKNLQTDQGEATVLAIRDLTSIVQAGINASLGLPPSNVPVLSSFEDSFQPTTATIWVNCLWLISLGLSISVSLLAMLAKRWCYVFSRGSRGFGTSYERAINRQKAWDAIERWKMELVIEQLPTFMHVALMLFFFGLVIYLSEIHRTTMVVMTVLVSIVVIVYCSLTMLPLWFPDCPMTTPFNRTVSFWCSYLSRHWGRFHRSVQLSNFAYYITNNPILIRVWLLFVTTYQAVVALSAHLLRLLIGPRNGNASTAGASRNWRIHFRGASVSETRPFPSPNEDYRQAFCAVVWLLTHSKDLAVVQQVLEYLNTFPEVIMDSTESAIISILPFLPLSNTLNNFQPTQLGQIKLSLNQQLSLRCYVRVSVHENNNALMTSVVYKWGNQERGNDGGSAGGF